MTHHRPSPGEGGKSPSVLRASPTIGRIVVKLCVAEIFLLLSGFLAGIAGFYLENPGPPWGDEVTFRIEAVRRAAEVLFTGPLTVDLKHLSWLMRWASFAFPVAVLVLAATVAWFFGRNSFRRLLIRRRGGHIIVAGSTDAAGLVLSWHHPTLWIVPGPLTLSSRAAMPAHAAMIVGDPADPQTLLHSGMFRATQIMLLGNDGARNGAMALSLLSGVSRARKDAWHCSLHVSVLTAALAEELERRLEPTPLPPGLEVHLFHPQTLGVRRLFLDMPTERFRLGGSDQCVRVVVVGLGDWGGEVLRRLLLECHPLAPGRVEITVLDRDAAYLGRVFAENHPDRAMLPPISWVPLDVLNERAFGSWLDGAVAQEPPPCAYFVCLGGGELSYSTAMRLESGLRERLADAAPVYYHRNTGSAHEPCGSSALHPFGSADEALTEELVLQTQRDALARQIHENYLRACVKDGARLGDRPSLQEWGRLPLTFKRENRSQADHHLFKVRQLGCRLRSSPSPRPFLFGSAALERLAAAEHLRWCASRLLAGWRYGAVRDDARKLHPDIVPYEKLTERIKDLDRDAVNNLPALFAGLGMEIVADMVLGIGTAAHEGSADLADLGREALEAARASFPDRFPVLLVRMDRPSERLMGRAWHEAGGALRLIFDEPVYLLRERVNAEECAAFDDLVRCAESTRVLRKSDGAPSPAGHVLNRTGGKFSVSEITLQAGNAP